MSTPKRDTRLLFLTVIGICLFFVMTYAGRLAQLTSLNHEVLYWEEKIALAAERQHALEAELRYVQSDAHVEQLAHDELGMVKPGEELVVIVQAKEPIDTMAVPQLEQENVAPFWRQWLNRIGLIATE